MDQQEQYDKGEVVWAKIRGYPWWPGIIGQVIKEGSDQIKYLVNFIGDNSQQSNHSFSSSTLPSSQLAKYQDKYNEIAPKIKAKSQKDSVLIADQILKGQTTYEQEVKKLQQKKCLKSVTKSHKSDQDSMSNHPSISRRRQYKSSRKFSSESEDHFPSSKKLRQQEDTSVTDQFAVQNEIQEILRIIQESRLNQATIENRISNLSNIIDQEKPDIMQMLQGQNGKNLVQIQKQLEIKMQGGVKGLTQSMNLIQTLIEKLKTTLLKLYFDPTEIIQQLHHVSGQKKITQKLLDKLQSQPDLIFDQLDDSEDSDDEASESSDSSSSEQKRQTKSKPEMKKITKEQPKIKKQGNKIKKNSNQIPNPTLRDRVCHQILQLIQDALEQRLGKKISVQIESRLRECDPDMGNNYKSKFNRIVDNLRKIKKNEINEIVSNSYDIEKLWNLINSGEELE